MLKGDNKMVQLNYDEMLIDYSASNINIKDGYVEIDGLDGSFTKIDIKYLPKKYIIGQEEE